MVEGPQRSEPDSDILNMSQITFPAGASLETFNIEPWFPGQIVQRLPFTGAIHVLARGYAAWRGQTSIAPIARDEVAVAATIESFLAAMVDLGNYCELPLEGKLANVTGNPTVTGLAASGGTITTTLSRSQTWNQGEWVRIENRCYMVRTSGVATRFVLDPNRPLKSNAAVTQPTTIRVRRTSPEGTILRRTRDFLGPWSFVWEEVV